MRRITVRQVLTVASVLGLVSSVALHTGSSPESQDPGRPDARSLLRDLPLSFIENRGQVDPRADYYLQGAGASVYFAPQGLAMSVSPGSERPAAELTLEFPGSRASSPVGLGRTPGTVGSFKEEQASGIPTYARVVYRDLWPGIDVVYSGTASRLKYQFEVDQGVDPDVVEMAWGGTRGLSVNDRGQLEVATTSGRMIDDVPYSYQMVGGRRVEVPTSYALGPGNTVGFQLGAHDPDLPLVIDPALLIYAGYLGGSGSEQGDNAIAVDGSGNTYLTGRTTSTQTTFPDGDPNADDAFPVPGPDQTHNGNPDAFVAKVNAAGTALVYAGYIGGSGEDRGKGIAVDGSGNAYITGDTASTQTTFPDGDPDANDLFPVPGPDQTHNGATFDAFVAKVNTAGTALLYAGYIGGSAEDFGSDIAVDGSGNAYVTGQTISTQTTFPDGDPNADDLFPVSGPDQTHNGGFSDAFVAKVNTAGTALVYAGYVGGSGDNDEGEGIAVDASGNAYLTGRTDSDQTTFPDGDPNADDLFPVPGPDQTYNGGSADAFVAKVSAGGAALVYAGYIGGAGTTDRADGIEVDGSGNAYVTGSTTSDQTTFPDGDPNADNLFPVPGLDQTHNGSSDAYVAKVNAGGTALVYAGYIGGAGGDPPDGIALDGSGNVYVTGFTTSDETTFPDGDPNADDLFPVPGPDQTFNGGFADTYVAKVNAAGTALVYAGYIGGGPSGNDDGTGIAVDGSGNAYVTGFTGADQTSFPDGDPNDDDLFPVPGPDQTHNGGDDVFVAKVEAFPLPLPPGPAPGPAAPSATCKGTTATLEGTAGDDTLTGTAGADVVASLGGKDTIKTLGGDDLVCAGDGNDSVNGGGGKDRVSGEGGKDRLRGGGGNDRLNGGPGNDTCIGGSGKDRAPGCETEKSL